MCAYVFLFKRVMNDIARNFTYYSQVLNVMLSLNEQYVCRTHAGECNAAILCDGDEQPDLRQFCSMFSPLKSHYLNLMEAFKIISHQHNDTVSTCCFPFYVQCLKGGPSTCSRSQEIDGSRQLCSIPSEHFHNSIAV